MTQLRKSYTITDDILVAKYTMAVAVNLTGVAAHRIRRFEEYGLCKPLRTDSRQRLFSDRDIQLIATIADLEQRGINLAGIKAILELKGYYASSH
jgi:MerR family glutamine synthetase transcriptional repressor